MAHDVFVSHSSHDKALAEQLVAILEKHEIRCWAAMRDALYGPTYAKQIVEAIKSSRLVVLLFSVHSNDSPHIIREVEQAVDRRIPVVTMRIQDITPGDDMAYFLKVGNWMDAFAGPFEPHAIKLSERVKLLLGQTDAPRPMPVIAQGPAPAPHAPIRPPEAAKSAPSVPAAPGAASAGPPAHKEKDTQIITSTPPWGKLAAGVAVLAAVAVAVGVVAKGMFNAPTEDTAPQVAPAAPQAAALTADQVVAQLDFKPAKSLQVSGPVTRREFEAFVAAQGRGYQTQAEKDANPFTWRSLAPDDSVAYISADEAAAFCKWLSTNGHKNVRLPTAAEWNDAIGGGIPPGNLWQLCSDSPPGGNAAEPAAANGASLKVIAKSSTEQRPWPSDHGLSTLGFRVIAQD